MDGQSTFMDRTAHFKVRRVISEKKILAGYFVITANQRTQLLCVLLYRYSKQDKSIIGVNIQKYV